MLCNIFVPEINVGSKYITVMLFHITGVSPHLVAVQGITHDAQELAAERVCHELLQIHE